MTVVSLKVTQAVFNIDNNIDNNIFANNIDGIIKKDVIVLLVEKIQLPIPVLYYLSLRL